MTQQSTRTRKSVLSAVVILAAGWITSTAAAQVDGSIIQPQAASTSYIVFGGFGAGNLIDQSGLSAAYTSGATDFDTFVATTTHTYNISDRLLCNSNGQAAPNGVVDLGGTITLDLGSTLAVDALAMWSVEFFGPEVMTSFDLYADSDGDFNNGTTALLGSYSPTVTILGQSFSFPLIQTRFVHLVVTGHGGGDYLKFDEFAFRYADPFLVTNTSDGPVSAAGDLRGSLRQAVFNANAVAGADTIEFDPNLAGGTITLTEGQLLINESVTINGLGADQLTISGGNASRLFTLGGAGANTYTFNDLTLADGDSTGGTVSGAGGAILMTQEPDDTINITRSVIRNNQTPNRHGSAIFLYLGNLNISDSAIINNGSGQGTIHVQDGSVSISNSTLSGNAGGFGTVWARSVFSTMTLSISHSTFADNQNVHAAVHYSAEFAGAATNVAYDNTIFADNGVPNFAVGGTAGTITVTSLGYNLLDDATGDATPEATDLLNTDPMLGVIEPQAGTFVHVPQVGSPAIDMGDPNAVAGANGVPLFDQRGSGFDRVSNGRLDIGAVERPCLIQNTTQGTSYPTIQQAIDAAVAGDVIELGACTYLDRQIALDDKDITIRGQGPGATIIDGQNGWLFSFDNDDQSTLEGLTLRNGRDVGLNLPIMVQGSTSLVIFRDCHFENNSTVAVGSIVAIDNQAIAAFESCEFTGNIATSVVETRAQAFAVFSLCKFSGNLASPVIGDGGSASVVDSLFHANTVSNPTVTALNNGVVDVVNCTFADTFAGDLTLGAASGGQVFATNSVFDGSASFFGPVTFDYCLLQGGVGTNIDGVPTFVDAAGDDYRLAAGSLGIDAGSTVPYFAAFGGGFDLAGNNRFVDDPSTVNTGIGALTYLDMGAYEFQGGAAPCPGDLDGDLQVALSDLAILLSNFGIASGALPEDGDLDGNTSVDLADLAILLSLFGTICP